MENTGNFYDDIREGDTKETYATSDAQAKDSQTKISDSKKWASRIFTTLATAGWIVITILIIDAIFNKSKITEWIMIGK